jgi:hypothetical protein
MAIIPLMRFIGLAIGLIAQGVPRMGQKDLT